MNRKLTAVLLITAAVLTNIAFTALGTVFNYPDVLKEPVDEILTAFRASQGTVTFWFAVLAFSAALFAPIAIGVGRLDTGRAMRFAVPVGIAAAAVQVIGLSRWPILVPGYAADATSSDPATAVAARDSFETAHRVLGTVIGETFGYTLTAAWTLLVLAALGRSVLGRSSLGRSSLGRSGLGGRPFAGRWFTVLGAVSAVLIAAGVLSPLGVSILDTANFVGYVLWSGWLVAFAVLLLRRPAAPAVSTVPATTGARR